MIAFQFAEAKIPFSNYCIKARIVLYQRIPYFHLTCYFVKFSIVSLCQCMMPAESPRGTIYRNVRMSQLCVVSASDNLTLLIAHCLGWFGWDGGMDSLFSGLFSTGQMALVIAKQPSIGTSNYSSTFFRNCLFLAARQQ